MLTFLVWACHVYGVIWLLVSLLFYVTSRTLSRMYRITPLTAWQALFAGLAWPAVAIGIIIMIRRGRALASAAAEAAGNGGCPAKGDVIDIG